MLNIGPQELILILIVALVIVGPQRLPELGRTIGKTLREFRKIQDDVKDTIKFDLNDQTEYLRPRKSPRAPTPKGNGDVTEAAAPAPIDTPDSSGAVAPDSLMQPGNNASSETEIDPEARAVE
jgi:sec-independent protein translocase protein TatA